MKVRAASASRGPISQHGISLVSAQIAVHVHNVAANAAVANPGVCIRVLRADERPDFVSLNSLARQVDEHAPLVVEAGGSDISQERQYRAFCGSGNPTSGAHRSAIHQRGEYPRPTFYGELIHGHWYTCQGKEKEKSAPDEGGWVVLDFGSEEELLAWL